MVPMIVVSSRLLVVVTAKAIPNCCSLRCAPTNLAAVVVVVVVVVVVAAAAVAAAAAAVAPSYDGFFPASHRFERTERPF